MMHLVYYPSRLQFVEFLHQLSEETIVVTPHPAKADGLREQVKGNLKIDVITIYKFLTQLNQQLNLETEPLQYKRKSEIIMLATILKDRVADINYEIFTNAYQVFSDLRSYSLNKELISSLLDEFDPRIKEIVQTLWLVMEAMNFHDEHSFTNELGLLLARSDESEEKKNYVFFGFQHMSGPQIDLIKSLALRHQVYVPQPISVREKIRPSDWVHWLGVPEQNEIRLSGSKKELKVKWLSINYRELTKTLKQNLIKGDQIVLGQKKLNSLSHQIIPSDLIEFKIPYQILNEKTKEVFLYLKNTQYDFSSLFESLENLKVKDDFLKLKVIQLAQENIRKLKELTDKELIFDQVSLSALFESIILDQPRTSIVNLNKNEAECYLFDLSSLDRLNREKRIILCLDERLGDISTSSQPYGEKMMQKIASIAPIKRSSLEALYIQDDYFDLISEQESILLMPDDILEHHVGWKNFFQELTFLKTGSLVTHEVQRKSPLKIQESHLPSKKLSSSKIQSYLDCPKKYYFTYVEPLGLNPRYLSDFTESQVGEIVHAVIEIMLSSDLKLSDVVNQAIYKFAEKNQVTLSKRAYFLRKTMIQNRSQNGLGLIGKFQASMPKLKIEVEKKIENESLSGRIDFFAENTSHVLLFDFKSSSSGAATFEELLTFDVIQLWVYLQSVSIQSKKTVIGYIVLENPDESIFLTDDQETYEKIKSEKWGKIKLIENIKDEYLNPFQHKLDATKNLMIEDKVFIDHPRKDKVCSYCPVNFLCFKGQHHE